MNTLILTIILIPLIEIYLFIEIGGQIGAGYTILFILLTAVIGLYFAKLEGINTIKSGMNQLTNNQMPIYEMISGAALAFAAVLLIIPGFATDIIGFLLIIPYMLPSQAIATAWITMFKNRKVSGPLGMLEAFGINPPDWLAYGPLPIAICVALSYFPFAFLFESIFNFYFF